VEQGGTITVFFADVRGFTEFTDSTQQLAEEFVKKNNLSPERARDYYDRIAAEQLQTVNLYLATIADTDQAASRHAGQIHGRLRNGVLGRPNREMNSMRFPVYAPPLMLNGRCIA
jgi:hypothetical protein